LRKDNGRFVSAKVFTDDELSTSNALPSRQLAFSAALSGGIIAVLVALVWFEATWIPPERMPAATQMAIRLAVTGSAAFTVYFLFGRYKLARVMGIKYEHLRGFLGVKTPIEDATQVIRALGDALGTGKK
jgi:hypothetical protein